MKKNYIYFGTATTNGCSTDVNYGQLESSIRAVENAAREEFGSGWKIKVNKLILEEDGVIVRCVEEVKTFTIR